MKDVVYAALDKENTGFILSLLNYLEKTLLFNSKKINTTWYFTIGKDTLIFLSNSSNNFE